LEDEVETPVVVRVDNMGAIFMTENVTSNSRTRHVDVRHRFVTDLVEKKVIEVVFVSSGDNLRDGQTKNVTKEICDKHAPHYVARKSYLDVATSGGGELAGHVHGSVGVLAVPHPGTLGSVGSLV
jgi:hypothetical protein